MIRSTSGNAAHTRTKRSKQAMASYPSINLQKMMCPTAKVSRKFSEPRTVLPAVTTWPT